MRFLLLLLALGFIAPQVQAQVTTDEVTLLNNNFSPSVAHKVSIGTQIQNAQLYSYSDFTTEGLNKSERVAVVSYVFGTDGGAVSTIGLGVTLPDNAVVTKVVQDIYDDCDSTSDTGTIKLVLPTDGDLSAATTCDDTNVGVTDTLPSGTPVKLTAARQLSATIATNAVLVGSITWYVYYVIGM